MRISAPSPIQLPPTQLTSSALPSVTANNVPSTVTSVQATAELSATQDITPTLELTPMVPVAATSTKPLPATQIPAVIVVPLTQAPETNEQRWRAQQLDRKVDDPASIYVAPNAITLWWYDPLSSQSVPIGTISGEFPVQAEFLLRGSQQAALEVPYRINSDFGLTAISEAVRERMNAAGYTQSVEAYVLQTADIHAK